VTSIWRLTRDALAFGCIAALPILAAKYAAESLARSYTMTVKITYTDGSTETYTKVTDFKNDGVVVKFRGSLDGSTLSLWEINWASIRKIEMTPSA
jgi:hypothetical protein